ncbi:MAG: hypothetical protein V3T02_09330 [Alphaproteobacteria bacterium]
MFGFSIFKLLFTIAVIIAIWYGYKHICRLAAGAKRALESDDAESGGEPDAQSLIQCPVCGTYGDPAAAKRCDRDDCPY